MEFKKKKNPYIPLQKNTHTKKKEEGKKRKKQI